MNKITQTILASNLNNFRENTSETKSFLSSFKTIIFCFLFFFIATLGWGQMLQQDFSSSTTVTNYVSATPTNGQFNAIGTSGPGTVLSINTTTSNKLRFARTGNAGAYSRTTDFSPTPGSILYRFDMTLSANSVAATNAATFQVGSGYGTTNSTETNVNTHSRLGVNFTTTAGQFSLRDLTNSINSANFSGTQTIFWAINNSGSILTYKAPDGSFETVANDTYDLWIGTTKVFNDIAATTTTQTLTDLKFVISGANGTMDFDNFLVDPIPAVPTSAAASSIGSGGFTANWATVLGVTGYRIDVATDAAFTNLVSGYTDLYISGQATNSLSVTGLNPSATYYYRVRGASQYTVGEFAGGNSASQNLTTTSAFNITYANLQFPTADQSINEGSTITYYGRVYAAGVTDSPGEGTALDAWIGYSATNNNPNGGSWTWVPATYNVDDGANNDEYQGTLSGLTPGTYYVAYRYNVSGGSYIYGGKNNAIWASTSDSAQLTVNSILVDFCNLQSPANGTITQGGTFNVYAKVYLNGVTNTGSPGAGISGWIGYSTSNTNPNTWTNWVSASFNTDIGNDDEYVANIATSLPAGTYYYASRFQRTGSTEYKYGDINGVWSNIANNGVLTVNQPIPVVTAASLNGTYNTAFTYNVIATNSPTAYVVSGGTLPTGLSLNTTTGAITGTPTAAGSFTANVTATNSGGTSVAAALSFTIAKANQTITFAALPAKTVGDPTFTLTATASSGLTVTYASSNLLVATISGNTVTIVGAGTTTITASQTGDTNYNAATDVNQSLLVYDVATKLVFGTAPPATGNVGVNLTTFTVRAERPDNSLDTFYTGTITISKTSGSGILSGTLTATAIAGIATFNAAQFDTADTYTITATATGLTSVTSGTIVVALAPISLGNYQFTGTSSSSGPVARLVASGVASNISFSSYGRSGLTINTGTNENDLFSVQPSTGNFGTALNTSTYQEFTVTPALGYFVDLNSISLLVSRTSAGPTNTIVRSSLDSFTSDVGSFTNPTTAATRTVSLTGTSSVPLTFRFYLFGGGSTGFSRNDDVTLFGNVKCVQPIAFNVTGGGSGCAASGVAVGLANSQVGISYQLKNGGTNTGTPVAGTGSAISFGNQLVAGTYTVEATNSACSLNLAMTGTAVVTTNPTPTLNTISATAACAGTPSNVTMTGLLPSTAGSFTYTNSVTGPVVYTVSGTSDASGNFTFSTPNLPIAANGAIITITSGTATATGCLATFTGKTVVVTVNPTPTLNTISATAACAGSPSNVTMTGLLPNTAGSFTYTNSFTGATVYPVSGTSDASGNFTFSTPNLPLIANGAIITITSGTATATGCSATFTGKTVVVTVNPILTTTFTQVAPVCSGETFTLPTTSNNGISGTWSPAINTTATTMYTFTPTAGQCGTTATMTVTVGGTTTWSGSSWDNGAPTSVTTAIIAGNYSEAAALNACTLTVNNNAIVVIPSGTNVTLNGSLTVASGSSFTLNNNANLLQNLDVANSGAIVVKRQSSALMRLDYTLWSSPVFNQGLYSFSPFTFDNRFYTYKTDTNLYSTTALAMNVTGTNAAGVNGTDQNNVKFGVGKGYLIRVPYNHPTAPVKFNGTFTGVPTNGDKSVTLNNFAAGQRFNLVGNPYPSPISMATLASNNSSDITGSFYFWRKTNSTLTSPGYCTWTAGTFVSNEEAQVFDPLGVIQVGQGFMVEAKEAGSSLTFKNGQRVANNANQIFRLSNPSNLEIPTTVEYNRLWLNMTSPASEFVQMSVGYNTGATQEEDLFDGKYFNDGPIALTSTIGTTNYTIQGRALPFTPSDVVALSYKVTNAGNYTIAIDHVDGLFASGTQDVFIKDNLNNTYTNLNTTPFTFASEAGTFSNRLEIVYENQLSVPTTSFTANNVVIYKNNEDFVINSGVATMAEITVYDIRGSVLMTKKGINATETRINAGTTNQVLLVQITTNEGIKVTKKVIN